MGLIRLQKALAEAGVASRRGAEELIAAGRIRVNGNPVNQPGFKVDPAHDRIEVDGQPVEPATDKVYLMLNKPPGYVCSRRKFKDQPTIYDLLDTPYRLNYVGRLDKDSAGLLILTNDGELVNHLTHPRYGQEKEYLVEINRPVSEDMLQRLGAGVDIGEGEPEFVRAKRVKRLGKNQLSIVLTQGKKRQLRRMLMAVDCRVRSLKRIRIKNLHLGNLPQGKVRQLTPTQVADLLADHPPNLTRTR